MKTGSRWLVTALVALAAGCSAPVSTPSADPRSHREGTNDVDPRTALTASDQGCAGSTLVSTGGPSPKNPQTLAIRWTGFSNFELAYNGQIILLDAYFDRGSLFPPLGFKAADVKRANVILIGHGHVDHMSDAASVGARTGAVVVGPRRGVVVVSPCLGGLSHARRA